MPNLEGKETVGLKGRKGMCDGVVGFAFKKVLRNAFNI